MKKRGRLKARGEGSPGKAIPKGDPPWRSPWTLALVAVMAAVIALVFISPDNGDVDPDPPDDPGPGKVYHDVGIPLANVSKEVSFFTYTSGSNEVRFFVVLDENRSIHVGLDACDVCYTRKLGFHQEDVKMKCNSCGKSYAIEGIGTANLPGTCWPGFVPWEFSEGYVLIDTEYLDSKSYMFK
jgi:uncharacterized membrane protein